MLRARVLATLAYAEAELGHLDLAERLCTEALDMPGTDAETCGIVHGQLAVVLLRQGERERALAEFTTAIRSLSTDHAALGRNLLNRGNLHLDTGSPRRALADFQRAMVEAEQAGLRDQAAKAQHNAGYAWFLLGDHVRALHAMDAVAGYLSSQSPAQQAVCLSDRAEVLVAVGLHDEAVADLTKAIALFRAAGARRAAAAAMLVLARHYASEQPTKGLALARAAARRFAAMGSEVGRLRAEALVAVCLRGSGRRRVPPVADLAATLADRGLRQESDMLKLAACAWLLERGRLTEAAEVPLPRSTTARPDLWAAAVAAHRDMSLGRPGRALGKIQRALDAGHALKATLGSLELQASDAGAPAYLGRLGLRIALAKDDPELVLEWSERARAASSRVVAVHPPADERLAADLAELRTIVSLGGDPARAKALRRAIRERAWQTVGSGATQPVGTAAGITAALAAADAVLVALLIAGDTADAPVTALVVAPEGASLTPLGPLQAMEKLLAGLGADLDVAASDLGPGLRASVRGSLAARLTALDRVLLRPIADRIAGRRVVLTPSGALSQVPWPLLPSLAGLSVTVARSATAWAAAARPATPRRVVFAAGPRLTRADDEVDACAAHWPDPTVLTGASAAVRTLAAAARTADVVHLAAHGVHHRQNPLFSHVELADGPVFGYELERFDPLPGLVILSACELGSRTASDDPLGLATALLHAGVRTVLAAPAALSDADAARLMPDLHARLARGVPAWDALGAALTEFGPDAPPLVCFGAGW